MLQNVNLLYLGTQVLVLLDLSYLGRFWTQFEAWLSMQVVSVHGLMPAPNKATMRCTICPILGANSNMADGLLAMWSARSPREAHDLLANDDVSVTNQSDKEVQLLKILELDAEVKTALTTLASTVADEKRDDYKATTKLLADTSAMACDHV